jgi:hypothetical protein
MPSALTPIAWQSLSSSASTVTFSSIPGTYRDLRLVIQGIGSTSNMQPRMTINNDTAANYNYVSMQGDGASATSSSASGTTFIPFTFNSRVQTTYDWQSVVEVLDYSATDKHKTGILRPGNSANGVEAIGSRWASTSAVTSIQIYFFSGTWAAGSTFALYGVSA